MLLADFSMIQMIPVAALAMLSFILLKRSSRYFLRTPATRIAAYRPRMPAPVAPKEYERWQVEMHDLARELRAELDSKIVLLEQLIREANEAAARLETATELAQAAKSEASTP